MRGNKKDLTDRQFGRLCVEGHDKELWGKNKSGTCKACLRDTYLRNTYGITLVDFIHLYEAQGGACWICDRKFSSYITTKGNRIEVDHDHKITNKRASVRGLLCGGRFAGCNRRLGKIDNQEWLLKASQYIAIRPAQQILSGEE